MSNETMPKIPKEKDGRSTDPKKVKAIMEEMRGIAGSLYELSGQVSSLSLRLDALLRRVFSILKGAR